MSYQPELISIITACYNAAPFITETIESMMQTCPKLEQSLVDDASIHGSRALIKPFAIRITSIPLKSGDDFSQGLLMWRWGRSSKSNSWSASR
jgi:glycosyltransferase involved in cell wall biosynthesis